MKRKTKLLIFAAAFAMLCCGKEAYALEAPAPYEAEAVDAAGDAEEGAAAVYSVTFVFKPNGGAGTMENLTVTSDLTGAKLPANAFLRTGFTFAGWNTERDGSGVSYADQADALSFATEANHGKKITLYAQWKMGLPVITKVKKATPGTIQVNFKQVAGADGYEVQYSVNKKFNKKKTLKTKKLDKKAKSVELIDTTPGKMHYVRMRAYCNEGGKQIYSDWTDLTSKTKLKLKKVSTISNTKSMMSIEADVVLTGSGTGYHAKLVMGTSQSAVSYGIQYDSCAVAPYTGKAVTLIENVISNAPGGQSYTRPSGKSLKLGKKYHLMMTLDTKGNGAVYLNYKKIGGFQNSNLAKKKIHASDPITLRVEGSARLNGDTVKATFSKIRCKENSKFDENRQWGVLQHITNRTMKIKLMKNGSIVLHGKISGLPGGGDWDNMYGDVSAVCRLY